MSADIRELDRRTNHGIRVTLLWDAKTNRVFVSVVEEQDGGAFGFEVAGADAAEAFHHPYAYTAHSREHQTQAPRPQGLLDTRPHPHPPQNQLGRRQP